MPQHTSRRTWIVVADGAHARVVVPAAQHHFRTVLALDSTAAHSRSSDLGSDRPGRAFESASPTRHAVEPRTDPHELEKQRFLRLVAERIDAGLAETGFDRLVLVAPPHELPELRDALGKPAAALVVATVPKDLTKVPDHELGPHLAEWWTAPAEG